MEKNLNIYIKLNHFAVPLKQIHYCKSIILQFKKMKIYHTKQNRPIFRTSIVCRATLLQPPFFWHRHLFNHHYGEPPVGRALHRVLGKSWDKISPLALSLTGCREGVPSIFTGHAPLKQGTWPYCPQGHWLPCACGLLMVDASGLSRL